MNISLLLICLISNVSLIIGYVEIEDVEPVSSTNKSVIILKAENHGTLIQYEMEMIRKLNQFILELGFYKKDKSTFRQIFKTQDVDWCQVVSGKGSKANPLIRTFLKPLVHNIPFFSRCPLYGKVNFNLSFDRKMLIMFPIGVYKLRFHVYRNDDDNCGTSVMTIKINE